MTYEQQQVPVVQRGINEMNRKNKESAAPAAQDKAQGCSLLARLPGGDARLRSHGIIA